MLLGTTLLVRCSDPISTRLQHWVLRLCSFRREVFEGGDVRSTQPYLTRNR